MVLRAICLTPVGARQLHALAAPSFFLHCWFEPEPQTEHTPSLPSSAAAAARPHVVNPLFRMMIPTAMATKQTEKIPRTIRNIFNIHQTYDVPRHASSEPTNEVTA